MERNIVHWTYWLGIVSLVYYISFYKASLLFFVAAIASSSYAVFKSVKP